MKRSRGSIGRVAAKELIVAPNGDLYLAGLDFPLDVDGYRMGARFEATAGSRERHLVHLHKVWSGYEPTPKEMALIAAWEAAGD